MPQVPPPTLPNDTVWFGGNPDRATRCLRVCGDGLDPDEVTRLLGRAPTRSQRKDQGKRGRSEYPLFWSSMFILQRYLYLPGNVPCHRSA